MSMMINMPVTMNYNSTNKENEKPQKNKMNKIITDKEFEEKKTIT